MLQLLGTVKKLLGVCADFALYMQNLRTSGTEDFNEEVARSVTQWLDGVPGIKNVVLVPVNGTKNQNLIRKK